MPVPLPDDVQALLKQTAFCHIATVMPDGSPQVSVTWVDVDTDGTHILVNSVAGYQKVRNLERDPRVSLDIVGPDHPASVVNVRGRVVEMTTVGAWDHINALAQRYTGGPYTYGPPDQVRVILKIAPGKVQRFG